MRVFAISDLHLSFGVPRKNMGVFGPQWEGHTTKTECGWHSVVGENDLVLVPGDLSWAMRFEDAVPDLEFLGRLPGEKVLIRGNHDYWWRAISKVRRALPPRVHALQNDALRIGRVLLCGTRLWDPPGGFSFREIMQPVACRACDGTAGYAEVAAATPGEPIDPLETERLYKREIDRLRLSIKAMEEIAGPSDDCVRIAVTHFPPCDASLTPNSVTGLLECHGISHVVFGHLHNVRQDLDPAPFGERVGIRYHLTTCDYLNFKPVAIGTTD